MIINKGGTSYSIVKNFTCLGQALGDDGRCEEEIRKRIAIVKNILKDEGSTDINKDLTEHETVDPYVWLALLYGTKSSTISKEAKKHMETFELWSRRRMMKLS